MKVLLALGAAAAFSTSAHAAVNLVVNGGFEIGVNPAGETQLAAGDTTSIFGWRVMSAGVTYADESVWDAASGDRSVELGVDAGRGGIRQRVYGFNIGSRYVLTFDLSANPYDTAPRPKSARDVVSVTGGGPQIYAYSLTAANTPTNMLYQSATYYFTATGSFQDLQFVSLTRGAYHPIIDNVRITAVPEASTWAMLIVGFGLVGVNARRRRQRMVAA